MKHILILSLMIVMLGMTGCVQPNMNDSQRTKLEGTGTGALAGAAIGAMLGGRQGAMWGATLGAGAGLAAGSYVAGQKSKYAKKEDALNSNIASARETNKETRAYNKTLKKKIRATKKLIRQYKKNKVSKFEMFTENMSLKFEKTKADYKLSSIDKEIVEQKQALKTVRSSKKAKLRREISKMKRERRVLKRQTKTLARLVVQTSV